MMLLLSLLGAVVIGVVVSIWYQAHMRLYIRRLEGGGSHIRWWMVWMIIRGGPACAGVRPGEAHDCRSRAHVHFVQLACSHNARVVTRGRGALQNSDRIGCPRHGALMAWLEGVCIFGPAIHTLRTSVTGYVTPGRTKGPIAFVLGGRSGREA